MNGNQTEYHLQVEGISKTFGDVRAVEDLSFEVAAGEIFGLLGPNGAGKTTAIRIVLDILKSDGGRISILGGPMSEEKKARLGYLPEERGLYDEMKLLDVLVFLAQLKELSRAEARQRAERYLKEVELWEAHDRKVEALSRGMKQKAQFLAATLHEPDLIIIDEPFSGLDPVNTRIIKDLLYRMQDRGATIIMSTHQMHQVEQMCERILLIDRGRRVLYGDLDEIYQDFSGNTVEVDLHGSLEAVAGVERINAANGSYRLSLQAGVRPERVLEELVRDPQVTIERFEHLQPSLEEIFIEVVGRDVEAEELA